MKLSNRNGIFWLSLGALLAALTVGLGAFGAHGLESAIEGNVEDPAKRLENWETAARYQMYHCIGIILAGFGIALFGKKFSFSFAATCFLLGIILFSGALYVLAGTNFKIHWAVVPLGGLAMIIGWISLAIGFLKSTNVCNAESDHG